MATENDHCKTGVELAATAAAIPELPNDDDIAVEVPSLSKRFHSTLHNDDQTGLAECLEEMKSSPEVSKLPRISAKLDIVGSGTVSCDEMFERTCAKLREETSRTPGSDYLTKSYRDNTLAVSIEHPRSPQATAGTDTPQRLRSVAAALSAGHSDVGSRPEAATATYATGSNDVDSQAASPVDNRPTLPGSVARRQLFPPDDEDSGIGFQLMGGTSTETTLLGKMMLARNLSIDSGVFDSDSNSLARNLDHRRTKRGKLVNFHLVLVLSERTAIISVDEKLMLLCLETLRTNDVLRVHSPKPRPAYNRASSSSSYFRNISLEETDDTEQPLISTPIPTGATSLPFCHESPVTACCDVFGAWHGAVPAKQFGYCPGASVYHAATQRMYTVGGYHRSDMVRYIDSYDVINKTWDERQRVISGTLSWSLGNAALLSDGRMYLVGGAYSTTHFPELKTFAGTILLHGVTKHGGEQFLRPLASLNSERCHFALSTSADETTMMAIGGRGSHGTAIRSVESYNFSDNKWSYLASLNVPRSHCTAATLAGVPYVMGGDTTLFEESTSVVELYIPPRDKWLRHSARLLQPKQAAAACSHDNCIYLSGGLDRHKVFPSLEMLDPRTDTWRRLPSMCQPRSGHGMVVTDAGDIVVTGGFDGTAFLNSTECYNIRTGCWTTTMLPDQSRPTLATRV